MQNPTTGTAAKNAAAKNAAAKRKKPVAEAPEVPSDSTSQERIPADSDSQAAPAPQGNAQTHSGPTTRNTRTRLGTKMGKCDREAGRWMLKQGRANDLIESSHERDYDVMKGDAEPDSSYEIAVSGPNRHLLRRMESRSG